MATRKVELIANDFADQLFRPHGEYAAQLIGNVIWGQAAGPFNLEVVNAYRQLAKPLFTEAGTHGRFGTLTEFRKSTLMSIETLELFAETMAQIVRENPAFVCSAFVAGTDVEGRDLMASLFDQKVYRPMGFPHQMFDNRDAALAWLNSTIAGAA